MWPRICDIGRDRRGFVLTSLKAPFTDSDGDGLADVDEAGRFIDGTGKPLTIGLPLRSTWIQSTLGFMATPWAGFEMFYTGTHQTIDRPGGQLERRRFGFQVITAKPVRIR